MKKRDLMLFTLPFLILAIGATIGARREAVSKQRDLRQERFLNLRFTTVKLQSGNILMKPKTHFFPSFDVYQLKVLSVGDKFEYNDRHWRGTYKIIGTASDGVIIQYAYSGSPPAYEGSWSGIAKIGWR